MRSKNSLGKRLVTARKRQGLTLKQLEKLARVSATHLSGIERGETSPTILVLQKTANALERPLGYFLERSWFEQTSFLPLEQRPPAVRVAEGAVATPMTGGIVGHRLSPYLVHLDPGGETDLLEPPWDGCACIFVNTGRVSVNMSAHQVELDAGDSIHFQCRERFSIRNVSPVTAADFLFVADHRRSPRQTQPAELVSNISETPRIRSMGGP
ncbi:MAG: helix-turn-helix domain-containing protein [Candidatus Krumholzibacteriia bacterium]